MTNRCAWLLYNPAAGRFPAGPLLERALRVLSAAGWDAHIVKGEKEWPMSPRRLSHRAATLYL